MLRLPGFFFSGKTRTCGKDGGGAFLRAFRVSLSALFCLILVPYAFSGVDFPDPEGGWNYTFDGTSDTGGDGFTSLDGSWSHNNGSDEWDRSIIGEGAPGGVMSLTDEGISFLRIQMTGDPRGFDFPDPGNRKIYFGRNLSEEGVSDSALDEGFTISFRARVPTSGPLDDLHPAGADTTQPYPEEGDGYTITDGGKGPFGVKQASGGKITFSLATTFDTGDERQGLVMNNLNGSSVTGAVNFDSDGTQNLLPLDPTQWNEFWITIEPDPTGTGTHEVNIYHNGELVPHTFQVTAGNGSDFSDITYLGMGLSATPHSGAFDVDFFSYTEGVVIPPGAEAFVPPTVEIQSPFQENLFYSAENGLQFTASSGNDIEESGMSLVLNGVGRSADLTITGEGGERQARFDDLLSDRLYFAEITATDVEGLARTVETSFHTFSSGNFTWEANDWNFDGGQFHDNPNIDWSDDPNYFDMIGTEGVDEHTISDAGNDAYRLGSAVGTEPAGDLPREPWASDDRPDAIQYNVGWVAVDEWLNYTRTFPAGEYFVFARLARAGDVAFAAQLDRVTSDRAQSNQTTEKLGTFSKSTGTGGWQSYEFFPLLDDAGNIVSVALSGVETLRVTATQGGYNANFYMLVPAVEVPRVTDIQPDGGTFNDPADGISFTVHSEAGVDEEGIQLLLNGEDRSNQLVFTGDANERQVRFENLEPSRDYVVQIRVIDRNETANTFPFTGTPQEQSSLVGFGTWIPRELAFTDLPSQDIGTESNYILMGSGSAEELAPGDYDMVAGGWDIWGNDDGFHFVYQEVTGPFDIWTQVTSVSHADNWSKAGIMAREDLTPGSRHMMNIVTPQEGTNAWVAQKRPTANSGSSRWSGPNQVDGLDYPNVWVRLVRSGDEFIAYWSTDGDEWTEYARDTLDLPETVYAGLAFTSHNNNEDGLGTASFRNASGQAADLSDIPEPTDGVPAPSIVWDGNAHVISWEGTGLTLERADEVTGTWEALEGESSPYTETDNTGKRFYRLRGN